MSAVIISIFLIIEIPLMVITLLHALKPQVKMTQNTALHRGGKESFRNEIKVLDMSTLKLEWNVIKIIF